MASPREDVHVHDTWHAIGMRATTSHDFSVTDLLVPEAHSFDVVGPPRERGPLYRFPVTGIAELSFAAVALGCALHGIESFRQLAAAKRVHYGTDIVRDVPITQIRLAEAEVSLAAAGAAFYGIATTAWDRVVAGTGLDEADNARLTNTSIVAAEAATRALDLLLPLAGMSPLLPGSTLGHCWRDTHTVAQHALLSPLRTLPTSV